MCAKSSDNNSRDIRTFGRDPEKASMGTRRFSQRTDEAQKNIAARIDDVFHGSAKRARNADYEPKLITAKTADRAIKKAKNFLAIIQKVYYEQIGKN